MKRGLMVCSILLWPGAGVAQKPDLGTEVQREAGKRIYEHKCAQCHGEKGDGNGVAKDYFMPKPRDFTRGLFKIRTTPSGELPSHDDRREVIEKGMPYTGMPAWPGLSGEELDNVVYYLKTFTDDFAEADAIVPPIDIPKAPRFSAESAEKGAKTYLENKCADCHGTQGRTDGKSAPTLKNEWGDPIRPADLTKRWTFRGGSSREDIYRTFTTGLNGTPMPSYADLIQEEDRWHLVDYVYSLSRDEPEYSTVVVATGLEGEIDLEKGESLFEGAPPAFFPLIGQIIEPDRNFFPSASAVEVRAVYDADEIAIMLTWNDMTAERSGANSPSSPAPASDPASGESEGGALSDAVAVQIPSKHEPGVVKPYFLFGDARNSVDLWFADLAKNEAELFVGRGSQRLERVGQAIPAQSKYESGEWNVILKRDRHPEGGLSFDEGSFIPVAFSIWDGFNAERGNRRCVTSWYHLYLKPFHVESKATPMAGYAILTLLFEVAVIGVVRRKSGTPVPAFLSWSEGMKKSEQMHVDLGLSVLGGLVATMAMTIFLYLVMPTLLHEPMDLGALVGEMVDVGWALGVATHFVLGGLVFPLIFVVFFYPQLPGPPWVKGVVWGTMLWLVAELVAVPIAHGGIFHSAAGGLRAAGGFLLGHLLYGLVLGVVTGSSGEDVVDLGTES